MPADPVVVIDGVALRRPEAGDCTCLSCCAFRRHHYIARAVAVTLFAPVPFVIAVLIATHDRAIEAGAGVVGAFLIAGTMLAFLTGVAWYRPVRRLLHRRRPRSTTWPPAPPAVW